MKKVWFLCTGSSCRSQMAEAIVNTHLSEKWQAFSAGTQPAAYVHPKAISAFVEIGIQHTGKSKHTDEFWDVDFNLVTTVCDDVAENCPVWLGKGQRVHIGFPNPAKTDVMAAFQKVRDEIEYQTIPLLEAYEN